jgi:thiamine-monophosphate kinase
MTKLIDIGERALTRDILPKYCPALGDDCASIAFGDANIIVTTDPVPEPAAKVIAGDQDPYWLGWLLVVINASDLAAGGARPLGFVAAVECPADTEVQSFERVLAGIRDACISENLPYIGGNLREGPRLTAVGTAVGFAPQQETLHRKGISRGDLLVSVGVGGVFWRDALSVLAGLDMPDHRFSPLFRPRSQLGAISSIRTNVQIHAAMDNSDGLLATFEQLAIINDCRLVIDCGSLIVTNAERLGIDPCRLWLGWGDWNLVVAIAPDDMKLLQNAANSTGVPITQIGVAEAGPRGVWLSRGEKSIPAARLESERFSKDSWFSSGIQGYIECLKSVPVP